MLKFYIKDVNETLHGPGVGTGKMKEKPFPRQSGSPKLSPNAACR